MALSRTITDAMRQLERLYAMAHRDLERVTVAWNGRSRLAYERDVKKVLDRLDVSQAIFTRTVGGAVVRSEFREAERLLDADHLRITQAMVDAVEARFYRTLAQQTQTCRKAIKAELDKGYKQGMTLEDRRALQRNVIDRGIVGLIRTDGSRMGLEATGKAVVRTRVNQLQAESQLERYRKGDVSHVQFSAGGTCTFTGVGGTCTEMDGMVFPADAIPDWAQIPRHLFSNSRWLPVVAQPVAGDLQP